MQPIALLLAAGSSSRLGQPKQLVSFPHTHDTLLNVSIARATEAGFEPLVVLGAHRDRILPTLSSEVRHLHNPDWSHGMGSSLRVGLRFVLPRHPPHVLVTTCDQPFVTAHDLRALLHACTSSYDAAAAAYSGTFGVPVCFAPPSYAQLRDLPSKKGASALLRSGVLRVAHVPMPRASFDVDTPEDLRWIRDHAL